MSEKETLDFSAAMDRVDNDQDLFFELVDMFFEDYDAQMETISKGVDALNFSDIEATAHAMKSALGNLGGMVAYDAAFSLEQAGRESISENLREKFEAFKKAVADFKQAVSEKRG